MKNKLAKEKNLSLGERIGREFRSFFSNDDMQESKQIRTEEYQRYLKIFDKAENIQNARYIELNKYQLRRTGKMDMETLDKVANEMSPAEKLYGGP